MRRLLPILLIAAGLGAFRLLGNTQPIVELTTTVSDTVNARCNKCMGKGLLPCKTCGSQGYLRKYPRCSKCRGTGKVDWKMQGKQTSGLRSAPARCPDCSGSGEDRNREPKRTPCKTCDKLGRIKCTLCGGSGKTKTTNMRTIKTVRAEYSPWEKFIAALWIEPDPNCAPQEIAGVIPLAEYFIQMHSDEEKVKVTAYRDVKPAGDSWHIPVTLEGINSKEQKSVVFVVRNRQVVDTIKK